VFHVVLLFSDFFAQKRRQVSLYHTIEKYARGEHKKRGRSPLPLCENPTYIHFLNLSFNSLFFIDIHALKSAWPIPSPLAFRPSRPCFFGRLGSIPVRHPLVHAAAFFGESPLSYLLLGGSVV
jgi:hypothetical protein